MHSCAFLPSHWFRMMQALCTTLQFFRHSTNALMAFFLLVRMFSKPPSHLSHSTQDHRCPVFGRLVSPIAPTVGASTNFFCFWCFCRCGASWLCQVCFCFDCLFMGNLCEHLPFRHFSFHCLCETNQPNHDNSNVFCAQSNKNSFFGLSC